MIKYLPNALTLLRVISIPFFVILFMLDKTLIATVIYIIACITDYWDGKLARKYGIVSNFGKLMDPMADKLLVMSALILLWLPPISYIHWVVVVIIALREIAVSMLRQHYLKKNIIMAANDWGKLKTTAQMTGIITALVVYSALQLNFMKFLLPFERGMVLFIQYFFWVIVFVTILSGVKYFKHKKIVENE
ncbi:MAG: CDP-diacylglycerol--glycerol-3-phosphate 3-phosphatidyltransferase [Candidatus Cloacimonetes bacterium]|nr:CDP-diacylglycerol--glycerol-3-phosphate 3-phosphatidyltransferase [Candidatus Cloacimonadota bacterium]